MAVGRAAPASLKLHVPRRHRLICGLGIVSHRRVFAGKCFTKKERMLTNGSRALFLEPNHAAARHLDGSTGQSLLTSKYQHPFAQHQKIPQHKRNPAKRLCTIEPLNEGTTKNDGRTAGIQLWELSQSNITYVSLSPGESGGYIQIADTSSNV